MKRDYKALFISTMGSLACAPLALAQPADAPTPPPGAAAQAIQSAGVAPAQGAPVAEAPASPSSQVAEIVVTAEKRVQNLQKTPAAVTALTGAALTQGGITNLTSVQNVVPSARFQQEGNSTQVFLRGIGSNLDFGNIDQTVAFNFNGVYVPREGTSVPLFDIARLEVLPGPQGTLYGRSAIGGTVNVNFQRPGHELGGDALLEAGNYDLVHLSLAQNLPVNDQLALRAAVDYTYHDGYMTDGSFSANDIGGRLGLLYTPRSNVTIYLWAMAVNKAGSDANLVNKGTDPATGAYSENAFFHSNPYDTSRTGPLAIYAPFGQSVPDILHYHDFMEGGQIDVGLGHGLTLTYIPSYTYLNAQNYNYWLGAIPASNGEVYHQVTQELRLSESSTRLNWIAGLYGYQEINRGMAQVLYRLPGQFTSDSALRNQIEGLAAFGQATYSVTDRFRVTLGGRYSADNRSGRGISLADQVTPYTSQNTYYHWDYKVGAEYDIAPRIMGYATYQTGYQPGTYNEVASTPGSSNLVEDERISSITGGLKMRFLDNRLQVNDEAFYYDYKNLFIQSYDASKAYNPIFNAKEVEIPGDQLDIIFKLTPDDQLTGSVSYTHARDTNFITPDGANFDGFQPPYAADWTANIAYAHDFHFEPGYIHVAADARYESTFWADYVHNLGTRQDPYWKENAEITYFPNRGHWSLGVWVKNISNEAVLAATAAAGIPGPATAYLEAPRTFGMRATYHY